MNRIFLAFLMSVAITNFAYAETDPNKAILNSIDNASAKADLKKAAKVTLKKPAKPAQKTYSGRKAATWFSGKGDNYRMSLSFSSRPKYTRTVKGGKVKLQFTAPVKYKAPKIPTRFKKVFKALKETSKDGRNLAIEVDIVDGYNIDVSHTNSRVYIDLLKQKVVAKAPVKEAVKVDADKIKAPSYAVENVEKEVEKAVQKQAEEEREIATGVKFDSNSKGIERLIFDFPKAHKAAVFEKFGNLWIVFDLESEMPAPEGIGKSNIFAGFEVQNTKPLTIKIPLKQKTFATADRIGGRWEIEFDTNLKYEVEKPLQVFENKEYLSIASSAAGEVVTVKDEEFNEEFKLVPLAQSGEAIEKKISKREVIFEAAIQGIAFREINEFADLKSSETGLKIFKSAQKARQPINISKKPIYEFKDWRQYEAKDFAFRVKRIKKDRLDYAKFLFTQKLYTEAAVIFKGLKGYEANFLNGASYFMEGKYDFAIKAFNKVNLPFDVDETELLMWQIATNQKITETNPTLDQKIAFTDNFIIPDNIKNYPADISAQLILALAEKRANDGKTEIARSYLGMMPDKSPQREVLYKQYLTAYIDGLEGKHARAKASFEKLAEKTDDNKIRGRAYYNAAMQKFKLGLLDKNQLIEEIDKHRVVWRGDDFEYKLLTGLGELRYEQGQIVGALRNFKEAIKAFPTNPNNGEISRKMKRIYKETLLGDFSESKETYQALSTYYEFEELKPIGEQGEHITIELAEKLVALDLLEEAAKLLTRYARKVQDPEEKALVMTRVAILSYLNNNTKEASKVLKETEMASMPIYLQRERDVLRTEISIKEKDYKKAMSYLPKLDAKDAQKFATQVLWKQRQWKKLIARYKMQNKLSNEDIIRLTSAYSLISDQANLDEMSRLYGNRMKASQYAKTFSFVTQGAGIDYRDLVGSLRLDLAKDTVSTYKKRLDFGAIKKDKARGLKNNS